MIFKYFKRPSKNRNISLIDLKLYSNNPNLVSRKDLNAPFPFLLVKIKSDFNIVNFPFNSETNGEIISRSSLNQSKYVIPPNVLLANISALKKIDFENQEKKIKKMKIGELSKAIIKINVDYQKMHDSFFKYDYEPKLSIYGEIFGNNNGKKNHDRFSLSKEKIFYNSENGIISNSLKKALGIEKFPNGQIPFPWIKKMRKFGLPPAYSGIKIMGINKEFPKNVDKKLWGDIIQDNAGNIRKSFKTELLKNDILHKISDENQFDKKFSIFK